MIRSSTRMWPASILVAVAACSVSPRNEAIQKQRRDSIEQVRMDSIAAADPDSLHRAQVSGWSLVPSPSIVNLMVKYRSPQMSADDVRKLAEVELLHDGQKLQLDKKVKDLGPSIKLFARQPKFDERQTDKWQYVAFMQVGRFDAGIVPTAYTNLGVEYDTVSEAEYCVHLKVDAAGTFTSAVTKQKSGSCGDPTTAKPLDVGPEDSYNYGAAEFPNVARFNDDADDQPTIGVNCGAARWCEIGRPGTKRAKPFHEKFITPSSAQEKVKSWHDEQEITLWDGAAKKLKRGIRASIVPADGLGGLRRGEFTTGPVVARIYMEKKGPPYTKYEKWGLERGENEMRLWYGETTNGFEWWATFNPVGQAGNGRTFKVLPSSHFRPPPVARWRWDSTDEDIWVACDQGCCIVSSGETLIVKVDSAARAATGGRSATKRR